MTYAVSGLPAADLATCNRRDFETLDALKVVAAR
jgi:hypothetical protein